MKAITIDSLNISTFSFVSLSSAAVILMTRGIPYISISTSSLPAVDPDFFPGALELLIANPKERFYGVLYHFNITVDIDVSLEQKMLRNRAQHLFLFRNQNGI
jgi:hypothetical protein